MQPTSADTTAADILLTASGGLRARLARVQDAHSLVTMYQAALGDDGVGNPGCEPYPDPSLFNVNLMADNLSQGRIIILCEDDKLVLGAICLDVIGPYQFENNCMAVRVDSRGLKLGSFLMKAVSAFLEAKPLAINCTELVTHSLASQAAHFGDGYKAFCGFGYSHYPCVFFPDRPESVLWTWRLYGRAVHGDKNIDAETERLLSSIKRVRELHVPSRYQLLINQITQNLSLPYTCVQGKSRSGNDILTIQENDGYKHGYVILDPAVGDQVITNVLAAVDRLRSLEKRFIAVRLPANNPNCMVIANVLLERGFAFHALLPLYGWDEKNNTFFDILSLQWVSPSQLVSNPLPGATNSVIKLYGYPVNMTGVLVKAVASDLAGASND